VLATIQFDHQTPIVTHEINDVWADWSLPPKAQSIEAMGTELHPEGTLGIRHFGAHRFGTETV
jgi:hypothetical protein